MTIILTTHYIEEAEQMADRVGVINKGEIVLVEEKHTLMEKLGKKQLCLQVDPPLDRVPDALAPYALERAKDGRELVYTYAGDGDAKTGALLRDVIAQGIAVKDLDTRESSLEEIFVNLVRGRS